MEPIHQTALYTVYFDHALQRCVLHSSYTWGESGGGTGGTGLGVSVFSCNPQALKSHVANLREQIDNGTQHFDLPAPHRVQSRPTSGRSPTAPPPQLQTQPVKSLESKPGPATPKLQSPPETRPIQSSTVPPSSPGPSPTASPLSPAAPMNNNNNIPAEAKPAPKLLQPIAVP